MKIGRLQSKEEFFEVVKMLQNAISEVWSFTEPAEKKRLAKWLKDQLMRDDFDLFVAIDDDGIAGFGYGFEEGLVYLKEPHYVVDMVYVKPEKRRTNAAFLLFNALKKQAEKSGLNIVGYLFADNRRKDFTPTIAKRFATDKKPFLLAFYRRNDDKRDREDAIRKEVEETAGDEQKIRAEVQGGG